MLEFAFLYWYLPGVVLMSIWYGVYAYQGRLENFKVGDFLVIAFSGVMGWLMAVPLLMDLSPNIYTMIFEIFEFKLWKKKV